MGTHQYSKDLKSWKKLLLYSEDRSKVSEKIQQEILFKWTSIHHANENYILNNEQRNSCIQSILLDIIRYHYITWIAYNGERGAIIQQLEEGSFPSGTL